MTKKKLAGATLRAIEENAIEEDIARLNAVIADTSTMSNVLVRARKTRDFLVSGESLIYRMERNLERAVKEAVGQESA